jgi:integrase
VSTRLKNGRWIVEIYDPVTKEKRHVKAREFGVDAPQNERQAKALERVALNARDARRPGTGEETIDSFLERWTTDFPRGASTNLHNAERVGGFAQLHAGRVMRSFTKREVRPWALENPSRVPALRAMFNDAIDDGLVDENPFARLGIAAGGGREGITVLTEAEIDGLAELALGMHGELWGPEFAAMIRWGAYTCARPGETFAARYSLLDGDVYALAKQFNSRLGEETAPKHGSTGLIYVPEPALRAVLDKPRRLGDDLMFRSKRGKQFRQETLSRSWCPIRDAFVAQLPVSHHLRQRLAADPDDRLDFYELRHFGASYMLNELEIEPWVIAEQLRHSDGGTLVVKLYGHPSRAKAIERMRRGYRGSVRELRVASGDPQGIAQEAPAS